jgi:hypothetical protein
MWPHGAFEDIRRGLTSRRSMVLALLALLTLTGTIGYRFYNEPQLSPNTLAPQTIYAPQTVVVEDKIATATIRKAVRQKLRLRPFAPWLARFHFYPPPPALLRCSERFVGSVFQN